ncbi:MAG: ATP-binding protein [Christensenellaceae bacterium]|jgi:predicted AAA+ superfamily ATPase|nr:ATP-binding protein [Christensenellaceae bacterium]
MLKRKFTAALTEWKRTKKTECLLVEGARQVGKSFIIREFGKTNYDNFIEINLLKQKKFRATFESDGDNSFTAIFSRLTLLDPAIRFIPNKTLLFIDEIQECGSARTALKFIAEEATIDCIASGSMLGITHKTIASIPVGYERKIEMFSLDFEEFLWAKGYDSKQIDLLKEYFIKKEKVPFEVNEVMLVTLREYMVVGGMPEVVNKFIETKNFGLVFAEQEKILKSYHDDIAKYAPSSDRPKAISCYLSIPRQLSKEYTKFQYSIIEKGGTGRKFDSSLEWLRDAGLVKFCFNVNNPVFPLASYEKSDQFKIYLSDIGLLNAMYGFEMKAAVLSNTLTGPAKGGLYENLIADILFKKKRSLYYYKNDSNSQEIEFLIHDGAAAVPIEVKSGNGATVSLDTFLERFKPSYGLKLVSGNIGITESGKVTLPLYMAMFL